MTQHTPKFKMSSQDKRSALKKLDLKNLWHLSAVGFGSGLSPIIPGTMGTLMAIPFYLVLMHLPLYVYIAVVLFSWWLGNLICQKASDAMEVHDHGGIVWDEFVGFWITMLPVLMMGLDIYNWQLIGAGFVLFRIFDMIKPWPISWLDKNTHGGFGIMIDDIAAGVMAAIFLALLSGYIV